MRQLTFPYQQGDLDSLCSLYAVLNLLGHRGELGNEGVFKAMIKLVAYVKSHGEIEAALLRGVYRGDVVEFFKVLGYSNCRKYNNPDDSFILVSAQKGAVIFVKFPNDGNFTHYTVINTSAGFDSITLLDSYRYKEINTKDGKWWIDDEEIEILNIYALGNT